MSIGTQIVLQNCLQYIQKKEFDKARILLKKENLSSPNNPSVLRLLSVVSALSFDYFCALELIDQVIRLEPENAIAHSNRGNILKELGRHNEALFSLEKAITLQPDYAEAYCNMGNVLQDLHRYAEALGWYDKSIALQPDYAEAYSNKGNAFEQLGRHEDALNWYDQSTSVRPGYVDGYWNKAMTQLPSGDFVNGFQNFEARWAKSNPVDFLFPEIPRLQNIHNVKGKRILIWAEQGLGDSLQFCRYIEPLSILGAEITFLIPKPLISALSAINPFCDLVVNLDSLDLTFDLQSPLMSLPLAFGTTLESIPVNVPYLKSDSNKRNIFNGFLNKNNNLKVGVVWNGGFRADAPMLWAINKRRNIELEQIAKLREILGIDFYSLQKGDPAESELIAKKDTLWPNIINCVQWLDDFSDTAALIENLDLIISVDTSTAHLAGALGKPVWILNRYDSCWRWLRGRSDSPWYPTAKIYQQPKPGDWDSVIEQVKTDLNALALQHLNQ